MFGHEEFGELVLGDTITVNPYEDKYIPQNTLFNDKYSTQGTVFIDRYTPLEVVPENPD